MKAKIINPNREKSNYFAYGEVHEVVGINKTGAWLRGTIIAWYANDELKFIKDDEKKPV